MISRNRHILKYRGRYQSVSKLIENSTINSNYQINTSFGKAVQRTFHMNRSEITGVHGSYRDEYNRSIQNPAEFWYEAAKQVHWFQPPTFENTLTRSSEIHDGMYKWFHDGMINISYNCLDRHVIAGRGGNDALIYDSPLTGAKEIFSYSVLLNLVSRFASVLKNEYGVEKGDRVIIYMPMIPAAVVAMLACVRIGAIHSVVFGGFASAELATRILDCNPKVIVSANAGVEPGGKIVNYKKLLDDAIDIVSSRNSNDGISSAKMNLKSIIVRRLLVNGGECEMKIDRDRCYDEVMSKTHEGIDAVPLPSTHPNYILYTSGTTGKPKGIVRDTGSHATALKYSMDKFYNCGPDDTFWAASDIGWCVGHSYIVYGPLLQGSTTILYEGKPVGTPDAGAFWRVMEEYSVKTFFAAPTAFRVIKQADPESSLVDSYDLSNLQSIFLAGERSDPETIKYCEKCVRDYDVPIIDHWWQTELGWPALGNSIGLGKIPIRYGACAAPVPGYEVQIFQDDGKPAKVGSLGNMALKLPLPPGALPSLYNNDERYTKEYLSKYPGYYNTNDAAIIDSDGYIHVMSRTDDIINTAGHRLSTGAMEEILMKNKDVAEAAVIGVKDQYKGEVPVGFVTKISGSKINDEELCKTLIESVRSHMGPVASFKKVAVVKALPKTRSGKILRGTMAKIANGEKYTITPTIDDATVFDHLAPTIRELINK